MPYNDLPLIPPPTDLETRPVLQRCVGARAALAELKQAASLLPNPTILINTLPLLEAQASSEIEHIVTTTDRLALHTYEVKFRLDGRVSTTQAKTSDAGHAKKLVQAQYGPNVTVLSVKKVD